jgi:hypothetical protein
MTGGWDAVREEPAGMDKVAQGTEIALPFRIMPSRARNYRLAYSALVTGVAVLAGGILWGDSAVVQTTLALSSLLAFGFGIYFHQRERRYFAPRARYWMTISPQSLTIVTPDGEATYRWIELAPFLVTRVEGKYLTRHTLTSGKVDGPPLDDIDERKPALHISLGDFATELADDEQQCAQAMCTVLNDLRELCQSNGAQAGARVYTPPAGLVVAPMMTEASATPEPTKAEPHAPAPNRPKSTPQMVERQ